MIRMLIIRSANLSDPVRSRVILVLRALRVMKDHMQMAVRPVERNVMCITREPSQREHPGKLSGYPQRQKEHGDNCP